MTTTTRQLSPPAGSGASTSEEAQATLRDVYGVTFTPEQGSCLGDGFAAAPGSMRFLESGYYPPLSMSEHIIALYVRCFGDVPGAARAILQTVLVHGLTTPSEAQCLEGVFGAMPENDLARVLASDSATIVRYRTQLRSCNGPYAGQA